MPRSLEELKALWLPILLTNGKYTCAACKQINFAEMPDGPPSEDYDAEVFVFLPENSRICNECWEDDSRRVPFTYLLREEEYKLLIGFTRGKPKQ